ncbi:E3 ubiquitin-protein ligase UBR3-like [Lingula anatina]|uniref:E3 ubiquitin-protein ligase n=1 Tax=Lingula anatina TaxID=7574 RepID=A0A1S3KAI7_LINAN|nr:E3 ubiquitin-protein ligase UBR3-like [Lingula anatina]|eukprot:XP_013419454.1 E3 ubiquitin-protein ligase UBR3-like [Lingula anatina]
MQDADMFLGFLHSLSEMGAAMKQVLTGALTNPQVYRNFTETDGENSRSRLSLLHSQDNYLSALQTLRCPSIPENFTNIPGLKQELKHTTLLEELMFWTVKFEFPQKIVFLLLSLLPDEYFKVCFIKAFVQHYSRSSIALVNSVDRSTIANKVVHISVQLFSNEKYSRDMVLEHNLLHIMVVSLKHMIGNVLTGSDMQDAENNFHVVADCGQEIMKDHCYWPIISDLINVLSHQSIAHIFMDNKSLIELWMELISHFQGMNLNQRELTQHVEYEPGTYYAAFSAELEICASPMWSMVGHLKNEASRKLSRDVLSVILDEVESWFDAINLRGAFKVPQLSRSLLISFKPNPMQVSFHIPLHRYLAIFLSNAVRVQGLQLKELLPKEESLKLIMMHPLQLQVACCEIFCGLWVRNGLQIKGQAMTYIQCHFCNSLVDADMYLLQVCACGLDPTYFLHTVIERFHIQDWLTLSPIHHNPYLEAEKEPAMVEGMLSFLTTLLTTRLHTGMDDKETTRKEMVALLCVADRTHSQLMDLMPEKCGLTGQTKDFEATLKEVADYKAPTFEAGGELQQGMYVPKDFIWEEEFDPVFVSLRAVQRKDLQAAMDRYTKYIQQVGKYNEKQSPWPPFRPLGQVTEQYQGLRRLLHCKTFHGMIFSVLYKAVYEPQMSETIIYLCVYLLEMAVTTPATAGTDREIVVPKQVHDKLFKEWFPSNNIQQNLRHKIQQVLVSRETTHSQPVIIDLDTESLSEMFELAPSAVASTQGIITSGLHASALTGAASVQQGQGQHQGQGYSTGQNEGQGASSPHHKVTGQSDGSSGGTRPKYQSRGVATDFSSGRHSVIDINESLISLLIKLHNKLSGKPGSYVPEILRSTTMASVTSDQPSSESRIGNGPHFIGQLLDRIARINMDNARIVEEVYRLLQPQKTKETSAGPSAAQGVVDKEEKRRKARERQAKLMADFASKQRAFMEQAMELNDEEDSEDAGMEQTLPVVVKEYDCVICNQTTPSTPDRPVGMVALLQATSVLGHRRQVEEVRTMPTSEEEMRQVRESTNCGQVQAQRLRKMVTYFEESSCLQSMNIGWEGGVAAQTCGHYLHIDCHGSYMESVIQDRNLAHGLVVYKGEYWCPLCRQLANAVFPVLPDVGNVSVTRPVPSHPQQLVHRVAELLEHRHITGGSSEITHAMSAAMDNITNGTYAEYKNLTKSQIPESMQCFVCSVARCNLELELLQRGGSLCGQQGAAAAMTKRSAFLPLFHVLSLHSKILTLKPYTDLWQQVSGISQDSNTTSVTVYQKDVPLLLKDVTAILIQFMLNMPTALEKEYFTCLVQALYNLVCIQALAVTSCKFPEDERTAWKEKGTGVSVDSLEGLLSTIITHLGLGRLYEDVEMDTQIPAICQSVWSPQTVESSVQDFCFPFLRLAALLQCHLFHDKLPHRIDSDNEYQALCQFLGLVHGETPRTPSCGSRFVTTSALKWYCENPRSLLRGWCRAFNDFVSTEPCVGRYFLLVNPTWFSPRLLSLPREYDKIFQYYRKKPCHTCTRVPKEPAVCLICGQFLCFKESCCRQDQIHECVQHSIHCGAGTGLFLSVNSSVIVVVRGPRATLWGSVYLDEYGEEDRELKRGKPLYLSNERYKILEQQWITHSFDHTCKRWIFHQDRL